MIRAIKLDDRVSTAAQLQVGDLVQVAADGFRVLLNNRPDGEALIGQPAAERIHVAAHQAGLASHYVPIALPRLGAAEVRQFHDILAASDGPVLAFCRSGFRCALLWLLHEVGYGGRPLDQAMRQAATAGHDLSGQAEVIQRVLREVAAAT